jgi:hypothetical protein
VYSERRKGGDTMMRKDLIIAVLATFCLTATLFLVIPTRSQTASQYDPWLDTNADGKIDGKDLGETAFAFGSYGDPTKDVNVINWLSPQPETVYFGSYYCNFDGSESGGAAPLYVGDYSLMNIYLNFTDVKIDSGEVFFYALIGWGQTSEFGVGEPEETASKTMVEVWRDNINNYTGIVNVCTGSYIVKAPYVSIRPMIMNVFESYNGSATVSVYVFLSHGSPENSITASGFPIYVGPWRASSKIGLFGPYSIEGFRQATFKVAANSTCHIDFRDYECQSITLASLDVTSLGYGCSVTFQVTCAMIILVPSQPVKLNIDFYLTT